MKKNSEIYSQALLTLEGSKVLANFVMAVASDVHARSIVEYSESAVFHYQYSSISQLFIRIKAGEEGNVLHFIESAAEFVLGWLSKEADFAVNGVVRGALDCTPVPKPHSACLEDRQFVYAVNETIQGNKPIEIGYLLSSLNLGFAPKWSVPVSLLRVKSTESSVAVGVAQILELAQSAECKAHLVVISADSGYSHASFFAPLYAQENVVNVVRLKTCNVWEHAPRKTKGTDGIYGDCYHLRPKNAETKYKNPKTGELVVAKPSIEEREYDQIEVYETTTKSGKVIEVTLYLHRSMMKRSKGKHNMKDKPFDLVVVTMRNKATNKLMYNKPMYLAVIGPRKPEVSLRAAYEQHYAHRYDIEPNNRFMKQQLQLEKFGTPHADHFDMWLSIICLAEALLLLTSAELTEDQLTPKKKWHRRSTTPTEIASATDTTTDTTPTDTTTTEIAPTTDTIPTSKTAPVISRPTIADTRKAAEKLFLTFDSTPFFPQNYKKGKGRKKGSKFEPKSKHQVVRKGKKKAKMTTLAAVKDTKT